MNYDRNSKTIYAKVVSRAVARFSQLKLLNIQCFVFKIFKTGYVTIKILKNIMLKY